jgi:class 3 adenylate cyclase
MCRVTGRDFLASAAILEAIPRLPHNVTAAALGEIALRGREDDVQLFALTRGARKHLYQGS